MRPFSHYIKHPNEFIGGVIVKLNRLFRNDELYLKIVFRCLMCRRLDLNNPKTFSEKLQWLKLYNRKPEYTKMVDKYAVKEYVAEKVGEQYIIPTLGVWNRVEDIDWNSLPKQFVLKTTHAGGGNGVVICKDKTTFDREKAIAKLGRSMKTNPYYTLREWPYKNVQPRIIAEEFIEVEGQKDLPDYKIYCFNGEPKYCQVIRDRNTKETIDFYDMKWSLKPFIGLDPVAQNGMTAVPRPVHLEEMVDVCKKLSEDIPFVRVDLYVVNGKEYFGEITFFPASGMGEFKPQEWNCLLGDMIELPDKQNIK